MIQEDLHALVCI